MFGRCDWTIFIFNFNFPSFFFKVAIFFTHKFKKMENGFFEKGDILHLKFKKMKRVSVETIKNKRVVLKGWERGVGSIKQESWLWQTKNDKNVRKLIYKQAFFFLPPLTASISGFCWAFYCVWVFERYVYSSTSKSVSPVSNRVLIYIYVGMDVFICLCLWWGSSLTAIFTHYGSKQQLLMSNVVMRWA